MPQQSGGISLSGETTRSRAAIDPRTAAGPALWHGRFLKLAGGLLLLRVAYLAVVPLDLVPDEAYYWDWSRQLDWGYYSKPPMVAWIIAGATWLLGHSAFAVRLPAALLSVVALAAGYALASRMYGPRVGFWGAVVASASAGSAALGMLMTIDAPLVACWCLALLGFWLMLQGERPSWISMALTASALGGGLLAKQTMLAFFPLAGLFLLLSPQDRRQLKTPRLWGTAALGLACLTPVVWWNARHGWITLEHTREHFGSSPVGLARQLARFAEFLAGQLGVVAPVTFPLLIMVLGLALFDFRRLARRERFLLCFSAVPLAGVLVLSLVQRVQPNWPAPFYSAGLVLLAAWGCGAINLRQRLDRRRGAFRTAWIVGAVTAGLVYLAPLVLSWGSLAGSSIDLAARLRGWSDLGQALGQVTARSTGPMLLIAATGRGPISELAFYTPGQPRVFAWRFGEAILSQHDLWDGPHDHLGADAWIITPAGSPPPQALADSFDQVRSVGPLSVAAGRRNEQQLEVWQAQRLHRWPLARYGVPGPADHRWGRRPHGPTLR